MRYQFEVLKEDDGKKAHEILVSRYGFSRVQVKKIRLYGELLVNGHAQRMIDPLYYKDFVHASYEAEDELPHNAVVEAQADLPIFFQDEWFLVVGKPAGLLTHPSYTGETDSLITRLSKYRLHPITRLDRGTSGLIVLAKSGQAHFSLTNTKVTKAYTGIVFGGPSTSEGIIDAPIGRLDGSIIEREIRNDGKSSQTRFELMKHYGSNKILASALRFELLTGRTHQIRVHCQHAGFSMFGDSLYNPATHEREKLRQTCGDALLKKLEVLSEELGHQALHASAISFKHPYSDADLSFEMPWPEDLQLLDQALVEFNCPSK